MSYFIALHLDEFPSPHTRLKWIHRESLDSRPQIARRHVPQTFPPRRGRQRRCWRPHDEARASRVARRPKRGSRFSRHVVGCTGGMGAFDVMFSEFVNMGQVLLVSFL